MTAYPGKLSTLALVNPQKVNPKTNQELSEEVTMPMVHEEFSKIAERNKIDQFRAMVSECIQ